MHALKIWAKKFYTSKRSKQYATWSYPLTGCRLCSRIQEVAKEKRNGVEWSTTSAVARGSP